MSVTILKCLFTLKFLNGKKTQQETRDKKLHFTGEQIESQRDCFVQRPTENSRKGKT